MTCSCDSNEHHGVVTFGGAPMTLVGTLNRIGLEAPDFTALKNDLTPASLHDYRGKKVLISVVPSLDTEVCDLQTRRFNQEAANLPNVHVLTISMDLPFAQARWCGAVGIDKVETLSDHRDADFGNKYGLLIKELRLLTRAVLAVDENGKLIHQQIVPEITTQPDYEAALAAVR